MVSEFIDAALDTSLLYPYNFVVVIDLKEYVSLCWTSRFIKKYLKPAYNQSGGFWQNTDKLGCFKILLFKVNCISAVCSLLVQI